MDVSALKRDLEGLKIEEWMWTFNMPTDHPRLSFTNVWVPDSAILGEDLPANGERSDYLRAELREGRAYASTIQDSSMLRTLARSTCLIVRPPHAPATRAGDSAEILVIA